MSESQFSERGMSQNEIGEGDLRLKTGVVPENKSEADNRMFPT